MQLNLVDIINSFTVSNVPIKGSHCFPTDSFIKAVSQTFFKPEPSTRQHCRIKGSPQIDSNHKKHILRVISLTYRFLLFTYRFPSSLFTDDFSNFLCLSEKHQLSFVYTFATVGSCEIWIDASLIHIPYMKTNHIKGWKSPISACLFKRLSRIRDTRTQWGT